MTGSIPASVELDVQLQPRDALQLACRIRSILLLIALNMLGSGVSGPSLQFIVTSFFAGDGGDCELHPTSEPCRHGAANLALYQGISNGLSHGVAWLVAMVMGSWSDAMGRRPFLRAKAVFAMLPALGLCLHVFGGFSLWLYLVLSPMLYAFDTVAVFMACINDLITEPHLRSSAFGVMMGLSIVLMGVAIPVGGVLPERAAVATYFGATLVQAAYLFMGFPETLPQSVAKRELSGLGSVVSTSSRVFVRNSFIFRMMLVLVLTGFSLAGLMTVIPPYSMAYLGMGRKQLAMSAMIGGVSVALSLAFLLPPMLKHLGEVGTLKVSLAFSALFPVLVPLCSDYWQYSILMALLCGPGVLSIPVTSAIKSNLVGEDEQGIVQGALASVRVLATAISDPLFGMLYRLLTDKGANTSRFAAMPAFMIVAVLAASGFLVAWTLPALPPVPGEKTRFDYESAPEELEMNSTTSASESTFSEESSESDSPFRVMTT